MDSHGSVRFGGIVREFRHRLGLTQQELAARSGLSLGAVRDLEQGRSARPRPGSVRALADVLELDPGRRDALRALVPRSAPAPAPYGGPVRIRVLAPLAVVRGTQPVPLGSGRHRAVLARLALTPGHPVGRAELIALLWADAAPATAANILQTHVSRLRRVLGAAPRDDAARLTLTPGGYRLDLDEYGLDLLAYRARLAEGRRVAGTDPRRAFEAFGAALDLWQGPSPVEDVLELQGDPLVTALTEERVDATVHLARLGESLRRQPEVLPRLRRLAPRHPWHEALHARLIAALAATGQQAAALQAYDGIRARLAGELGIDPGEELAEARQGVLERRWDTGERVRGRGRPAPVG